MVRSELVLEQKGSNRLLHFMENGEMPANLEMLSIVVVPEGGSVDNHPHEGETEVYYIQQGTGEYDDNGKKVSVKPGDVMVCYDGASHGIVNTGDGELSFVAVIVKS